MTESATEVAIVHDLTSYVPALLRRQADATGALPRAARRESLPAAVMFADISGSTALAERLAERGVERGAEDLSRALNAYFGLLIETVDANGGDVVKFAGDALLAVWPAAEAGLADAAARAAACGLAVQTLDGQVGVVGSRLTLRIGIGAGDLLLASLGGEGGHWEFVATGPAAFQSYTAQGDAQTGQVVLSPEAWALVAELAEGERLASGAVGLDRLDRARAAQPLLWPPAPAGEGCGLDAYAPQAVLGRLLAGQAGWLAELRRVTTLFVKVPGLDLRTAFDEAQAVVGELQRVLARFEGTVARLAVDDKGPVLLAAFGLPPLAHEDDAARALEAALALRAALAAAGQSGAIGISTGRAFCGAVGNARRCEYTMIGDAINLAARLMQAAGDGVLCDEPTRRAAAGRLSFEELAPIAVKGKAQPVVIARPIGPAKQAARASATVIGRVAERAVLRERLEALVQHGAGGVVVVEGEAGIGKSCLVEDLIERGKTAGATVLVGAGNAIEKTTPYYAWRSVVAQALRLEAAPDEPVARRRHIVDQLGADANRSAEASARLVDLAPLLNAVLPLDLPENETTRAMEGEARALSTQELVTAVLRSAAQAAPALLVLEDTHWLDSASWALLRAVAQRVSPVLLVLATRPMPDPLPREYGELCDDPDTIRLRLEALPPDDTLALVCGRLRVGSLPLPVATLIRERAAGHPFFSEELAYSLRDRGIITIVDGVCQVAPGVGELGAIGFPDTVQGVVVSRIDRLSADEQLTAKVASVVGRTFPFETVHDVYPTGRATEALHRDIDQLQRGDFTLREADAPDLSYRFKHVITQEVAYGLMLFSQRRQLHASVAAWLEQHRADDIAAFYPLLAHHWTNAIEAAWAEPALAAKAIQYLELSGQQAVRSSANAEAIGFLTEALRLDREVGGPDDAARRIRRGSWERLIGEACFRLGRMADAREHLRTAIGLLLDKPPPASTAALALDLVAQLARQLVHRAAPRAFLGRASPDRRALLAEAAHAYDTFANVYYIGAEIVPMAHGWLCALNIAERAGLSTGLVHGYSSLSTFLALGGMRGPADGYFKRGLAAAEELDDLAAFARLWFQRGWVLLNSWDQTAAVDAMERAKALYERLGDRRWAETIHLNMTNIAVYRGELARAAVQFALAAEWGSQRGDLQTQTWCAIGWAALELMMGEGDAALTRLDVTQARLGDTFAATGDPCIEAKAHSVRALAHLRRGERVEAEAALRLGLETLTRASHLPYYAHPPAELFAATALALHESGPPADRARLAGLVQRSLGLLEKVARERPLARPGALIWRASHEHATGRSAKALRGWQRGIAEAQRLELPYEEALGLYEMGRWTGRTDDLARAAGLFESIGASYDAERARSAGGG